MMWVKGSRRAFRITEGVLWLDAAGGIKKDIQCWADGSISHLLKMNEGSASLKNAGHMPECYLINNA